MAEEGEKEAKHAERRVMISASQNVKKGKRREIATMSFKYQRLQD
jgi:hypothetical protein